MSDRRHEFAVHEADGAHELAEALDHYDSLGYSLSYLLATPGTRKGEATTYTLVMVRDKPEPAEATVDVPACEELPWPDRIREMLDRIRNAKTYSMGLPGDERAIEVLSILLQEAGEGKA